MNTFLLQVVENFTPTDTLATEKTEEFLSIFMLLFKGGWLMLPIILLSIIAVYIFIERYLTIKKAANIDSNFMANIRDYVFNGNIEAASTLCKNTDSPFARMLTKGLMRIGKPLKDINVAVENEGKLEIYRLERNLATIATISGAAPMLGFLGTVTGMIKAFYKIANAGNNISPGLLAGGIYEAMITTAAGLLVGILAYVGYNYLVSMVENVVYKMEATSVDFIDLLQEPVG